MSCVSLGPRQRVQLVPGERDRVLDLARDLERPRGEVGRGDRARVQDGPLLGQVLARRQACGVVAGLAHLLFRLGAKHRLYSNVDMRAAFRPRSFVRVSGPAAEEYLDRMVSNDVAALGPGESCEALLLTPKARVIAPLVVLRRGHEDFLLLTEPELGERVRAELRPLPLRGEGRDRARGAHVARRLRRRGDPDGRLRRAGGGGARRGARADGLAGGARAAPHPGGHAGVGEGDRRPRPARRGRADRARGQLHQGLLSRARSRSRGCTTAATRTAGSACLRSRSFPRPRPSSSYEGKSVGRITSAAPNGDGAVALAYVRREVPEDAELAVGHSIATPATLTIPERP